MYPLDMSGVLQDRITLALSPEVCAVAHADLEKIIQQEESSVKEIRLRTQHADVKWYVGMMFQHKRYSYIGCIYGWDVSSLDVLLSFRCAESSNAFVSQNAHRKSRG